METDKNSSVNGRSCRLPELLLAIYMFFCFHIEYFCFMVVKKTSVNPCQDREEKKKKKNKYIVAGLVR